MTKILLGLCAGVMLAVLMASAQDSAEQELPQIRRAIADLGLRVARLEHAGGVAAGPADSSNPVVARSMVVVGIQTAEGQPVDQDRMDDLQDDIDSLQKTVDYHKDNADRVGGNTYYVHGYYDTGHYGYDHSNSGRNAQEHSQHAMANRYSTQMGIKTGQLNKLKRAAATPHQVIHGHDGDVIFTLRTKYDLAGKLESISIGDTVTWAGTRDSADDNSENWSISSIKKIDRQ